MTPDESITGLTTADEVAAKAEAIFGAPLTSTGLIHVATAWRRRPERYVSLEIDPEAPKCAHQAFVLNLTRARADAILTTGKLLRGQPALEHCLEGPGQVPRALADWRQSLGKRSPPVTLVLTSGRGLDLSHPVFRSWTRPVVYTSRQGQWELESRAADHGVEVVGVDEPSVEGAIELLRYEFGAATIAIEAGPSVSRQLYEPPPRVDELQLAVYCGSNLPVRVRGESFLSAGDLGRMFSRVSPPYRISTRAGEWSLQRFLR